MNARRVAAAAGVVCAALEQRNTATGIAAALEAAGLLQSPESAAELVALREQVAALEQHLDTAIAGFNASAMRITELEGQAICPSQMTVSSGTSRCALPVRHGGDHRTAEKNHHWSDEYADAARVRPTEDPHDSPLHHSYAVGRDLPEDGAA